MSAHGAPSRLASRHGSSTPGPGSRWCVARGLAVALLGPFFAPYAPDEIFGAAFAQPSSDHLARPRLPRPRRPQPLPLGRPLRDLHRARRHARRRARRHRHRASASAYWRGWIDGSFDARRPTWRSPSPPLILALLLLAGVRQRASPLVVIALAVTHAPRVAAHRARSGAGGVDLPYVEAARARGERALYVVGREILPNIRRRCWSTSGSA